ncbi:xanthine dehydrogenase [Pseudomonas sp. FW215-R2]|uniref:XdhC family protein n=1 Tax=unclassified Pseudomonas TaxID=196821 RepID=UPI000C882FBD|nr:MULTISPECIES: XdhC family protein [unclassified Pseudomonas]PMX03115.1 xanthine dehydrogenase [Pseudomonas sp. FW215-R2]PMX11920.1 xanthine dehydrogenase [Pseudomonas sp. FW215-L1]PMX25590.1 xanthine dehydrogenase [Pseudomonas sp. FW215-E1]PNA32592.1 xanthine dehydrogenase [Pseudomonas sp. FW215-R4]
MEQLDLQVIQQARAWIAQGQPVWLCTVLATFGSAPRGPGAMLACLSSGENRGSLSGGCIEDDFVERVAGQFFKPGSQVIRYGEGGLTPNLALPCGGVLDVLVEYLAPTNDTDEHLAAVEAALSGAGLITRQVLLGTELCRIGPGSMDTARVDVGVEQVAIRMGAVQRLLLAGLSPVAEFCASYAIALGYEVILCEPREEVIGGFRLPGVEVHEVLPAVYIANGGCHASTAVVALTHDPRLDDLTLLEAVRTQAFYIGAMGSQRTSSKRLERLARIGGLDAVSLNRIHAPIGLRLGSKTPAEIALAVMADILRVSNGIQRHAL